MKLGGGKTNGFKFYHPKSHYRFEDGKNGEVIVVKKADPEKLEQLKKKRHKRD